MKITCEHSGITFETKDSQQEYIKKLEEINDRLIKTISQINATYHCPKPMVVCDLCHAKLFNQEAMKPK